MKTKRFSWGIPISPVLVLATFLTVFLPPNLARAAVSTRTFTTTFTRTNTPQYTYTKTLTPTITPTFTRTLTPTNTPIVFTSTSTSTSTNTPTPTVPVGVNTNTRTFTATPSASPTNTPPNQYGLPNAYKLYDLEYIPCPVTLMGFEQLIPPPSLTTANDNDLTSGLNAPKNTARWVIHLKLSTNPVDSNGVTIGYHIIETRLGTAPGGNNNAGGGMSNNAIGVGEWSAAGAARVTLGSDLVTYAEGVTVDMQNLSRTYVWVGAKAPYSEEYQFEGDPRYCPYADVKSNAGYNWYWGTSNVASSAWTGYGGFSQAQTTVAGWSANGSANPAGQGYAGAPIDVPRYHAYYRQALFNTQAVFSFLNGWCTYYYGLGGEFGGDQSPFTGGITLVAKPWAPTSTGVSVVSELAGWNGVIQGMRVASRYVETTNAWHAAPCIGELFPDNAYETCWKQYSSAPPSGIVTQCVGGNLPLTCTVGGAPATFYRANLCAPPLQPSSGITINYPFFSAASPRTIWSEQGVAGAPSFFLGSTASGPATSYFENLGLGSVASVTVSSLGVNLGLMFNYPVPYTLGATRPFGVTVTGSGNLPPEWTSTGYYPHTTLSVPAVGGVSRVFYPYNDSGNTSYNYGMASIEVSKVSGGVTQNFFNVLNGLAPSGATGNSILGKLVLIQLMRGFFDGGMMTGTEHVVQLPLVSMLYPNNSGIVKPSAGSIPVTWGLYWTRWGNNPYTEEYPVTYTADASVSMSYVPLYSDGTKNGSVTVWHYMLSPTNIDTTLGVLPTGALGSAVILNTPSYNWNVSGLTNGTYYIMVEAYRKNYAQGYSYHATSFSLQQ